MFVLTCILYYVNLGTSTRTKFFTISKSCSKSKRQDLNCTLRKVGWTITNL